MLFLKLLAVLFSIMGISLFIAKKAKVKLEFGILIAISSIISLLYIFSLINLLLPITVIIFVIGIILSIIYIFKRDYTLIKESKVSLTFSAILILFLFFTLTNIKPLSFDNFSHWLLISTQTLEFNNLPDASNILTTYFEYPPGSTCFIYYCCLFFGNSEFCILFSQTILEILLLLPLFTFTYNKGKGILYIVVMLFIVTCLVIDIAVADLLVDSLLGIMALASFMFLYQYKDNLRKVLLLLIPINLTLLLIKNIAIFFFAIEMLYILYLLFKSKKEFKQNLINFFIAIIPFLLFILWKIRCKVVFSSLNYSAAQSVSLTNYQSNFSLKTTEDIKNIIGNFLKNLLDLNNLYTIIILVLLLGIIFWYVINKKICKNKVSLKSIIIVILVLLGIYLAYTFALLFAYIFSVTLDEALRLASFERYIYSVIILIMGIVLILYFSKTSNPSWGNYSLIIGLLLIILLSKNTLILIGVQDYKNSTRYNIEEITQDFPNASGNKILVISSITKTDGYVKFLMTYLLETNQYTLIQDTNELKNITLDKYDYVITTDNDENVKNFLSSKTSYNGDTGWYKIE